MPNPWLTRAAHWRSHADEHGLSNLDSPTLLTMLDETRKDIADHESLVAAYRVNPDLKTETAEIQAEMTAAHHLVDTFRAALAIRKAA